MFCSIIFSRDAFLSFGRCALSISNSGQIKEFEVNLSVLFLSLRRVFDILDENEECCERDTCSFEIGVLSRDCCNDHLMKEKFSVLIDYLLSVFPIPRFPEKRCFGLRSKT